MNYAECVAAGIDAEKVAKHQKALEKLMKAMAADNIMLFGGGDGSSLRPWRGEPDDCLLILAGINAVNLDGGAGAQRLCADGLVRGES
jgi:exopolysaccharide biosynthesis protein